ncbi:MAG TPA: NAD(P)/FAD-dependent oxidoreductase [Solirubrobacterales bacterium]|jgi:flavin-dependent dehydrogenase|nr:NAD(P)/FAD-dependent oxidoreductase [Solirubrobacterales bacterium]
MPTRATKRGNERTSLEGAYDVLVCGASFAGLAVARELAGSGADVLILDRYEIGERQTSACGIPTQWLEEMGLMEAERQRFDSLVIHTPHGDSRYRLPWTFSTFDYRTLCALLWADCDARFETAKVEGLLGGAVNGTDAVAVETDRGVVSAPLVVDALGWRRVLAGPAGYQPPDAPLSRGLEVHPGGGAEDLEIWIDRRYVPAGYGWSFPAGEETRIGVGSFDPKFHVRETTELLAADLERDNVRYQGNWIPHKLRKGTGRGVFFAGDSAGHCLPLTAEGIRTALYFGMGLGRELRGVVEGRQSREQAAAHYAEFNDSHERKFEWMLRVQKLVPRIPPRLVGPLIRVLGVKRFVDWSFRHYLAIAPPEFASGPPQRAKSDVPTPV